MNMGAPGIHLIKDEDRLWLFDVIDKVVHKMDWLSTKSANKLPYRTIEHVHDNKRVGEYRVDDGLQWWTNGFWAGMLWLMYHQTAKDKYAEIARKAEVWLDECFVTFYGLHHDVGFMWQPSAVADYRLTGNPDSRRRALHAANLLAGRFNPVGKFIRAWDDVHNGEDTRGWAIIDCMFNLSLLYWASEETGDPRFKHTACMHADTVMEHFIRPDGSSEHIVEFDPVTGKKIRIHGGQGHADGSSWTRGQGWALYGFYISYVHTGKSEYLDAARRVARYFISNIPESGIIPVDFKQPAHPALEDSIAAALAASGFIDLARCPAVDEVESRRYMAEAIRLLRVLDQQRCHYGADRDSFLVNGTGSYHDAEGHHVSYVYGDYFYLEALFKLKGDDYFIW